MQEGKLLGQRLGHIVSKDGIKVDPKRIDAIETINIPIKKKKIQTFLGKIIFLRRFIPNFVEIVKLITDMSKKDSEIKWTVEAKVSFKQVNKSIIKALVLASLDYTK
jgi:hypothetical protein